MTMTPHRYDFAVYQGVTMYIPFAIEAPDGTTYDLSAVGDGYTEGRLTIRDQVGGTALVELTTDNGGIVIDAFTDADGIDWSGYWYLSAAAAASLVEWGEGQYQFEVADAPGDVGNVERPLYGTVHLDPEVTT